MARKPAPVADTQKPEGVSLDQRFNSYVALYNKFGQFELG